MPTVVMLDSTAQPAIHGADVGLRVALGRSWSVIGGYLILSHIEEEGEGGMIRLARHPLRLGLAWEHAINALVLQPAFSLIIDFSYFEMRRLFGNMKSPEDTNDLTFALLPAIKIEYWCGEPTGAFPVRSRRDIAKRAALCHDRRR
ncbi:MAG: hypothetical protein GY847_17715 [Proteobacteria bacterium]|nr:hypothetical protein [Pseudomonadota bacterium]